jgi:hypothetical protein
MSRRYVRKEIETHARLRHPCVVQMMRFFEDGEAVAWRFVVVRA